MTDRDNPKAPAEVEMTSEHESVQTHPATLPMSLLYRGHEIALGREGNGWWARIDTLSVDTMLHSEQEAAFADAKAFIDGFLKAGRPTTKVNSVAQVLCGRAATDWPRSAWARPGLQ
jgi:hypothetical protein